jgi:hypothetical protein
MPIASCQNAKSLILVQDRRHYNHAKFPDRPEFPYFLIPQRRETTRLQIQDPPNTATGDRAARAFGDPNPLRPVKGPQVRTARVSLHRLMEDSPYLEGVRRNHAIARSGRRTKYRIGKPSTDPSTTQEFAVIKKTRSCASLDWDLNCANVRAEATRAYYPPSFWPGAGSLFGPRGTSGNSPPDNHRA